MDIQALKNGVEAAKAEIRRCEALVLASDGPDPEDHNIQFKRGRRVQVSAGMLDAYRQLRMARQTYCDAYYAWLDAIEPSGLNAATK